MHSPRTHQYKGLASLAQHGRYGDTVLAHINPQEAALLARLSGGVTLNPDTGLPEFFFKSIKKFFKKSTIGKILKPVIRIGGGILGGLFGGPLGAAAGSGIASLLTGGNLKNAGINAALAGLGSGAANYFQGRDLLGTNNFSGLFSGGGGEEAQGLSEVTPEIGESTKYLKDYAGLSNEATKAFPSTKGLAQYASDAVDWAKENPIKAGIGGLGLAAALIPPGEDKIPRNQQVVQGQEWDDYPDIKLRPYQRPTYNPYA